MRFRIASAVLIAMLACAASSAMAAGNACSGMTVGQLASLNGFVPFPANNAWNTDISNAPVDPNSDSLINYIGADVTLHPDFGSGSYAGQSIGIPYQVVSGAQRKVTIQLVAYGDESDPGPMPVPLHALIEGYPAPDDGDRHVIVLDKDGCWLYELYHSFPGKGGAWRADSTAVWDMTIDEQRPYTWTSADAAGLPIFAGLARYDEVAAGAINHALRFTVPKTQRAFTPPASHWASSITDTNAPPMGMRLRLKVGFDISGFSTQNQVILIALKKYGMILADNGSAIFISGAPDPRWNNDDLSQLKSIAAANFEVVLMDPLYTGANLPSGAEPVINSFTASPHSVAAGKRVTLRWSATDALYNLISPSIGPVRGDHVVIHPGATRTYTLYSTNQYGRATASVTVKVH